MVGIVALGVARSSSAAINQEVPPSLLISFLRLSPSLCVCRTTLIDLPLCSFVLILFVNVQSYDVTKTVLLAIHCFLAPSINFVSPPLPPFIARVLGPRPASLIREYGPGTVISATLNRIIHYLPDDLYIPFFCPPIPSEYLLLSNPTIRSHFSNLSSPRPFQLMSPSPSRRARIFI